MIEFENVSKSYANSSKYAVRNLNFDIEPETLNVILGESGSGKTTTAFCRTEYRLIADRLPP